MNGTNIRFIHVSLIIFCGWLVPFFFSLSIFRPVKQRCTYSRVSRTRCIQIGYRTVRKLYCRRQCVPGTVLLRKYTYCCTFVPGQQHSCQLPLIGQLEIIIIIIAIIIITFFHSFFFSLYHLFLKIPCYLDDRTISLIRKNGRGSNPFMDSTRLRIRWLIFLDDSSGAAAVVFFFCPRALPQTSASHSQPMGE
jgi:hypothetical protein